MARTVAVEFVDDLDGSPAQETVHFGVDGVFYEINLSTQHAALLRARLRRFVTAARPLPPSADPGVTDRIARSSDALSERNRAIRFWARQRRIAVSSCGPIPHTVAEAYRRELLGLPPDPGLPNLHRLHARQSQGAR